MSNFVRAIVKDKLTDGCLDRRGRGNDRRSRVGSHRRRDGGVCRDSAVRANEGYSRSSQGTEEEGGGAQQRAHRADHCIGLLRVSQTEALAVSGKRYDETKQVVVSVLEKV